MIQVIEFCNYGSLFFQFKVIENEEENWPDVPPFDDALVRLLLMDIAEGLLYL